MGSSHIHGVHKPRPNKRAPVPEPAPTVEVVDVAKRASSSTSSCTTGFYIAPAMGSTINSLDPLPITWNTTCLSVPAIDIYLYSPSSSNPRIHVWEGIALSRGTYDATLMPRWWNATASQSLQLAIVPAGQPPFLSTFPGGPVFTATYTQPSSGKPASADPSVVDSGITPVGDLANAKKTITPGKKAAAVLLPLIFIGLCIAAYIKMKRSRNVEKHKAWTEKIDKRMSTISTDWKAVSAAGANAAIRNSMAVGSRNSSFSFGGIRPSSSTFAVEGEDAANPQRPMSQMRTGVGLRNPNGAPTGERVSRVSFAPDTRVSRVSFADSRPSGESRRTRAYHSAYVPPVPALPDKEDEDQDITQDSEYSQEEREYNEKEEYNEKDDNDSDGHGTAASFSPRQTQGALTLTPEDIRSRIAAGKARNAAQQEKERERDEKKEKESGFAELMPALSMMRTGGTDSSANADDFLFATPAPQSPPPSYVKPTSASTPMQMGASPVMNSMPMQPMPANVMSPDEMLRAYAERKKMAAAGAGVGAGAGAGKPSISYPMPVASTTTPTPNNMRVLYNAATSNTVTSTHSAGSESFAPTEYTPSEYDLAYNGGLGMGPEAYDGGGAPPYSGVAPAYPFGHHPNGSIGVGEYGGAQYAIGEEEHEQEYRAA